MKKVLPFLFLAFLGCVQMKNGTEHSKGVQKNDLYTIYKIDSINSFYLIYAKKGVELYKIVSKKDIEDLNFSKIQVNNNYSFVLRSHYFNTVTRKMDILPENSLLVNCYYYDDSTAICLERDSIKDLHYAENINGLRLIK